MPFLFKPIGVLHTPFKKKTGIPIQGVFDPASKGRAEIFDEFEPGLKKIEGFSQFPMIGF